MSIDVKAFFSLLYELVEMLWRTRMAKTLMIGGLMPDAGLQFSVSPTKNRRNTAKR